MKRRPKKNGADNSLPAESGKPYGYILTLRALAGFAVEYPRHGAALRVLCVVAQHMNQDGVCRISQDTVAARLGISRQAVNKQIKLLDELDVLVFDSAQGRLSKYYLNQSDYENELAGDDDVAVRRQAKKAARALERQRRPDNVVALPVQPVRAEAEFG